MKHFLEDRYEQHTNHFQLQQHNFTILELGICKNDQFPDVKNVDMINYLIINLPSNKMDNICAFIFHSPYKQ